jgi:CTD nuclear envelope phosphatase 1
MNSLNIISARVSPAPSRSNSYSALSSTGSPTIGRRKSLGNAIEPPLEEDKEGEAQHDPPSNLEHEQDGSIDGEKPEHMDMDSQEGNPAVLSDPQRASWYAFYPKRISSAFINGIRWVFGALLAPGFYIAAFFYDPEGNLAPFYQVQKFGRWVWGRKGPNPLAQEAAHMEKMPLLESSNPPSRRNSTKPKNKHIRPSSSSGPETSESERSPSDSDAPNTASHMRRKSKTTGEEIAPARRSIRIKLHSEGKSKHTRSKSKASENGSPEEINEKVAAALKSPTSPSSSALTKYPRAPVPPRPLIPRRLPSYTVADPLAPRPQKTLILDLDETLIHSMAKGSRMSTGHMVEVRLSASHAPPGSSLGPTHPILYYVHKRPHCDDFLRRVCKWYNLVIFTASVQEYADPVIDWLEQERKFFSGRYYRQHCTYRHGAYIKDLSMVEADLRRVAILDNSPLSYLFHQGMYLFHSSLYRERSGEGVANTRQTTRYR